MTARSSSPSLASIPEEQSEILWQHIKTAGLIMDAGLASMRQQVGERAFKFASATINSGGKMQIVVTLSLAGTKALVLNLIAPDGEIVEIGRVEFVDADVTLN